MAGRVTHLSVQLTRLEEQLMEVDKACLTSFAVAAWLLKDRAQGSEF